MGTLAGQQHVMEILPQIRVLPQINDDSGLLSPPIHHELHSTHGAILRTKANKVNHSASVESTITDATAALLTTKFTPDPFRGTRRSAAGQSCVQQSFPPLTAQAARR
jgi:hypothetical protein